jgi:hypothetical protein
MFIKPKSSGLFSYQSTNYPNGTRKETRWELSGAALLLALVVISLLEGLPIDRILEGVKAWSWLAR